MSLEVAKPAWSLLAPPATKVLLGEFEAGDRIKVTAHAGELAFHEGAAKPATAGQQIS